MKKLISSLIDIWNDDYLSKKLKLWFMIRVLFLYPVEILEDFFGIYTDTTLK